MGDKPFPGVANIGSASNTPLGVWAVRITSEMWRKGIWSDARSVELMKEATCSDVASLSGMSADIDPACGLGGRSIFLGER